MDLLAINSIDSQPSRVGEPESPIDSGYFYFRYETRPNQIIIHAVDQYRVAKWLIDGELLGSAAYSSKRPCGARLPHGTTLDSFVAGDAKAMQEALKLRRLFEKKDLLRLTRVDEIPTSTPTPAEGKQP
jgi:hypothetical protein